MSPRNSRLIDRSFLAIALVGIGSLVGCGGTADGGGPSVDAGGDGAKCVAPLTTCGGTCVDLDTSPANCGACGHACAANAECSSGACVAPACKTDADCNDGFGCTIDTCTSAGSCGHTIGPNAGVTACAGGSFCTLDKGCVVGKACAKNADCADTDACHSNARCEPASSVCIWDPLDKDHDGHSPQVCGGDDCNDADPTVFPGAPELCDGMDNDCRGAVDDGATCSDAKKECRAGSCQCKADFTCASTSFCVDKDTDEGNCGSCGHACPAGATCTGGSCACAAPTPDSCGTRCTDVATDRYNCGGCGKPCGPGAVCVAGACACPASAPDACGGACVNRKTDPSNCGVCGKSCASAGPSGSACINGACACPGSAPSLCGGGTACVNLQSDPKNCGACGVACDSSSTCTLGACTCIGACPDKTTGKQCTSNADCDISGNGYAHCTISGTYIVGALDPTPICTQFDYTSDVCDPGLLDASGNQTQIMPCDGDMGLCVKTGSSPATCDPYCQLDDQGAWVKQCAGKNACLPSMLATDPATGKHLLAGTCTAGCSVDSDCPTGNVCDPVVKYCIGVRCTSDASCKSAWSGAPDAWKCDTAIGYCKYLYPKQLGEVCDATKTSNQDCLCLSEGPAQGVCSTLCTTGRSGDCPAAYACDPLLLVTDASGAPIYSASFALPAGMSGDCVMTCAADTDCKGGQKCALSAGMGSTKTCR